MLSPIALTMRDQVLGGLPRGGAASMAQAAREIFEVNARGLEADDDRVARCTEAIIEGAFSALVQMRGELVKEVCAALVRTAVARSHMNPRSAAVTAEAVSRALEREPTIAKHDFDAAIAGALSACEELGRPDRETIIASMRRAVSAIPSRACG